jgi:hypothetical protein
MQRISLVFATIILAVSAVLLAPATRAEGAPAPQLSSGTAVKIDEIAAKALTDTGAPSFYCDCAGQEGRI